jgi:hypothetical protein
MMNAAFPWDRNTQSLHQPDTAQGDTRSATAAEIDLERLVWDEEYRDEMRLHLAPGGPR